MMHRSWRKWTAGAGWVAALSLGLACRAGAADQETCAACHADETAQWQASAHAKAAGGPFRKYWNAHGRKPECLTCHSSQTDPNSTPSADAGVGCVACHGEMPETHPAEGKLKLPVDSAVCRTCHKGTYDQWKLSAHGQKNIRCFDCHKVHQMAQRIGEPDQACGSCHPARLKDFSHATHRQKGLHCVTCHMPAPAGSGMRIAGTGGRGHSFGVGVETCARCHREMVHEGHDVITLSEEVGRLKHLPAAELEVRERELEAETGDLGGALVHSRRARWWWLAGGLLLGGIAGAAGARWWQARRTSRRKPAKD